MTHFVSLTILSKASDDYRGYVLFREPDGDYYEAGLYEMRGEWGPTPVRAAENAWRDYNDEWTRFHRSERIGD